MSASDKKKLRREQNAAVMTEKQRKEQEEAKQLKIFTLVFISAIAIILCISLAFFAINATKNMGLAERFTTAATVNGQKLNTVEMNYYFHDAINDYYNDCYESYSDEVDSYLAAMGWDVSKPLNEQTKADAPEITWADFFVQEALAAAKRDYALYEKAMKDESFSLTEEQKSSIESVISNIEMWAPYYGFTSANQYVRAMYGNGSSVNSYEEYYERTVIADAYYEANLAKLAESYTPEQLREYEADGDKQLNYTSFSYDSVYLSYTYFRTGGTEDENGSVTYTEAENEAGRVALKEAAEKLATAKNHDELHEMAEEIETNETSTISVSHNKNSLYGTFSGANADLSAWLIDEDRKEGDVGLIPVVSKTTVDGQEVEKTNGYYVLIFEGRNENTDLMANVRHLLVKFTGGTEDEETGEVVYSDDDKAATKEIADGYLKTWQEGEKSEASFIELVKAHSEDEGSVETGGLYENINSGSSYVDNFLDWSIDPDRKAGDADVVETEYGYHVMYYVGDSEMSYRDKLIADEMAAIDQESWYNDLIGAATAEVANTEKLNLGLVYSPAS